MFSGIVEEIGTISQSETRTEGVRLAVQGQVVHEGLQEGESVAVNGVCLTVAAIGSKQFFVDVSPETLKVTTLGVVDSGSIVNLERSITLQQRIGGHFVSGHVDTIGTIVGLNHLGNAYIFRVDLDQSFLKYFVLKGSVAIDGVSLTVNKIVNAGFEVSIIPHTMERTTFGSKRVGDLVNIETDMMGKYIERLYESRTTQ